MAARTKPSHSLVITRSPLHSQEFLPRQTSWGAGVTRSKGAGPPVSDPGFVQPQDHRLENARHGPLRPCGVPSTPHGTGRGYGGAREQAGTGHRQRLDPQGHQGVGDVELAGRQTVVRRTARERRRVFAELVFRTTKYRPELAAKGFADFDAARPAQPASCSGTTSSTTTAASATSRPHSCVFLRR